jgi:predicted HicB family RNase H-like nuclease
MDDEELFKYMKHAHKNLLSFNEWVEKCLTEFIEVEDTN